MSGKRRGAGTLAPEDRALWDAVTQSIRPLRARKRETPVGEEESATSAERAPRKKLPGTEPQRAAKPSAPKPPPLVTLDRRTRSRVARGRVEIDASIDLHGLTLERARSHLANFLVSAQARDASLVLVITGKGGSGALRREVPFWLSSPELRATVIGFEEASRSHGGAGALYVRIRRPRASA